jgi:hypothetical protein
MRIARYQTLFAPDCAELDQKVNENISKGWQPYGNPYVWAPAPENPAADKGSVIVCQVMTTGSDIASY